MRRLTTLSFLSLTLCLTACDSTKEVLGFNRKVNDEFAILTTPPLSLPPNFDELPSPVAKSSYAENGNSTSNKARDAALNQFSHNVAHETDAKSTGESELLKNVKAHENDPEIRETISKEGRTEKEKKKSFVKDLLDIKDPSSGKALDPFEEKKRLEENKSNEGL